MKKCEKFKFNTKLKIKEYQTGRFRTVQYNQSVTTQKRSNPETIQDSSAEINSLIGTSQNHDDLLHGIDEESFVSELNEENIPIMLPHAQISTESLGKELDELKPFLVRDENNYVLVVLSKVDFSNGSFYISGCSKCVEVSRHFIS